MRHGLLRAARRAVLGLISVTLLAQTLTGAPTQAQDVNLLRDGSFDGAYSSRGRADLNLPTEWSIWVAESPHTEDWMNLPPVVYPHNGPDPAPHGGARALNLNKGYATFTAAVYQQVSVPDGANVSASAFAFLRTCKIPDGYDKCTSTADANAFTRIGIDPDGGTNPFDVDVVWSSNAAPHEEWQQMNVSATSTGTTVTLFLYSTQQWPAQINNVYWDDAALSIGGSGGVAAAAPGAPTPQPTSAQAEDAPFVNAQGERADGSIVHIVEAGDTLDSIALAYGKTRADLLAINNIADPRIIQIGQEIVIQLPPTPVITPTPQTTDEASGEVIVSTPIPPAAVRDAAPAPVRSVASGDVVNPIDPAAATASICVTFFEDGNINRIQDEGEAALAGGSILLTLTGETAGAPVGSHETGDDLDPYCFDDLAAGSYVVQAVAPDGYGLTTPDQLRTRANAGAQIHVAFGAAEGVATVEAPPPDNGRIVDTATAELDTAASASRLPDNLGLIVFAVAVVVLLGGMGIALRLRR